MKKDYPVNLQQLEDTEITLGLCESFAQYERGEGRPLKSVLKEFAKEHGFSLAHKTHPPTQIRR